MNGRLSIVGGSLLAIAGVLLTVTTFSLARQNHQLKQTIQTLIRSDHLQPGQTMAPLRGIDSDGRHVEISFGEGPEWTLFLVVSAKCPFCEKNWPAWKSLIAEFGQQPLRPVFLNIGRELPQEYISLHEMSKSLVILEVDPRSKDDYRLRSTPETILIGRSGEVRGVWVGVLTQSDLIQIRAAVR